MPPREITFIFNSFQCSYTAIPASPYCVVYLSFYSEPESNFLSGLGCSVLWVSGHDAALAARGWHAALLELWHHLQGLLGQQRFIIAGFGADAQLACQAALLLPADSLAGVALSGASLSLHQSGICTNGVLNRQTLQAALSWLNSSRPAFIAAACRHCNRWQSGLSPASCYPKFERWLLELVQQDGDSGFWQNRFFQNREGLKRFPDVPTLLIGGHNELTLSGTIALAQRLATQLTAPLCVFITEFIPPTPESFAADSPLQPPLFAWLKSLSRASAGFNTSQRCYNLALQRRDAPAARLQLSRWPVPQPQKLYLQARRLVTAKPVNISIADTALVYDPRATPGWAHGDFSCTAPAEDISGLPLAWREDTAAFLAEPLGDTTILAGTPEARLFLTANRSDAVIALRLVASAPQQRGELTRTGEILSYGVGRLAFRGGLHHPVPYSSDDGPAQLVIPLSPVFRILPAGIRLRLEVCTSAAPLWVAPPSCRRPAVLSLHHSQRALSRLMLPIAAGLLSAAQ